MVIVPRFARRHVDFEHAGVGGQADARPLVRVVLGQVALEEITPDAVRGEQAGDHVEQFAERRLQQRRQEQVQGVAARFERQRAAHGVGRELVQRQAQAGRAFGVEQCERAAAAGQLPAFG